MKSPEFINSGADNPNVRHTLTKGPAPEINASYNSKNQSVGSQ